MRPRAKTQRRRGAFRAMDIMLAALGYLGVGVFVVVLLAGVILTLLGLPGTILIVVDALIYSAATGWRIPWWALATLLGLSVIAEISDNLVSALGVKRYGGTTKGMVWALFGGIVGALALGAVLGPPLGLIGAVVAPILGGIIGGFGGAYWYERRQGRSQEEARRAGFGAMLGRVMGTVLKAVIAGIMVVVALTQAF